MVSARGAACILTALITCVRLAHMWSVVRCSDSWDWGSIVSQQAVHWGFPNDLRHNLISRSPQDPYQAMAKTSTDIMTSWLFPSYIFTLKNLLLHGSINTFNHVLSFSCNLNTLACKGVLCPADSFWNSSPFFPSSIIVGTELAKTFCFYLMWKITRNWETETVIKCFHYWFSYKKYESTWF